MPLETSAESPVPVRTVLRLVGDWIGRLGRIWVEGQIAELTRRGGTAFLTLRDPVAAVSVRVICPRAVLDANDPPPAEGARVVVWAKPDFNINRGSFALSAVEIRAVGIGELLARIERLRHALAAEGLFAAARDVYKRQVHTRARLVALSPAATLHRGYAIVQRSDASVVRAAAGIGDGEPLTLRFADDQLAVTTGKPAAKPKPRASSKAKVAR